MRVENNLYRSNFNYNINRQNSSYNPNFEGWGIKALNNISPKKVLFRVNQDKFWDDCYHMAGLLGTHTRTLASMLEYAPSKRVQFMRSLADTYNARNFAFQRNMKEDTEPVFKIYETVQKPDSAHFNILDKSQMPFTSLVKLFEKADTKKKLAFVQTMQHGILDGSKDSAGLIIKMLDSHNSEAFIKNPDDYKSYLKLNSKQPNCIETLDKLIDGGKYDRSVYDKKVLFENMMQSRLIRENVGQYKGYIEKNLTKDNEKFLRHFCNDFMAYRKGSSEDDRIDILKMFKSTNDKNLSVRLGIIEKFKYVYSQAETGISDIRSMKNLFKKIDSDEHAFNFIKKALNNNMKVESIEGYNTILSIVPSKKAEIFHKNIARIVRYTNPEERKSALVTEIENPFFPIKRVDEKRKREVITFENLKPDTKFEKLSKLFENKVNMYKFRRVKDAEVLPIEKQSEVDTIFALPKDFVNVPAISETITAPAAQERVSTVDLIETLKPVVNAKEPKLNLVRTLRISPAARKLQVKSDVNEVIKKKLGAKTYENQSWDYGIKATAMRLKMLPEIFDSISAARKAQRTAGLRPNVENKDAYSLYEKVTGRNRKLVRYMLKQTDAENNRIFNLKEIVALIEKTEAKIAQEKKVNPQFKAADAKAQYEEIFQNMVAEYGKLKRAKKAA